MGISCMILGSSGRGKSTSIRTLDPLTTIVVKVVNKPFPFKGTDWKKWDKDARSGSYIATDNYDTVRAIIKTAKSNGKNKVVIDDSQYLMANEFMKRAKEVGFQKFTDIAQNFWSLIMTANEGTDDDVRVYFLHHTESNDYGETKAKTIGKLLDEKISIEGLITIVLEANKDDKEYFFLTQNSGRNTCKSPIGMFGSEKIANDLNAVDTAICEFYDITN